MNVRVPLLALLACAAARAAPIEVHVLLPEAPSPTAVAIEDAERLLARLAGLPAGEVRLSVASDLDEARAAIARRPALALVSLPLYLESMASAPSARIVRSPTQSGRPSEVFHVLARSGGHVTSLRDLEGRRLCGNRLWDPGFVRMLLSGVEVSLVPMRRPLDGVKAVRAGAADAVLLSDLERRALSGMVPEGELLTVHRSLEVPLAPLVSYADGDPRVPRIAAALAKLCADPEGSLLCEGFGVDGFGEADGELYERALRQYRGEDPPH